jgi:hypothetical protein
LFLCAGWGACKKHPPVKPAAPAISPRAQQPNPPTAQLPRLTPEEAKALLTEDKISRFATYQKERMRATLDVVRPAPAAPRKGQTAAPQPQGPLSADERRAKLAAARQAALTKSGLSEEELGKLNQLLRPYYARLFHMQLAIKRAEKTLAELEAAKAKGKGQSDHDHGLPNVKRAQANQVTAARKDFAARYGDEALKLVQKHESEFFTINERVFDSGIHHLMR